LTTVPRNPKDAVRVIGMKLVHATLFYIRFAVIVKIYNFYLQRPNADLGCLAPTSARSGPHQPLAPRAVENQFGPAELKNAD
jgi:hypothetical protein